MLGCRQVKSWFSHYQKKKVAPATGAASTTKGGKKASGSTGSQPGSSSSAALDIETWKPKTKNKYCCKSVCKILKRMWRVF